MPITPSSFFFTESVTVLRAASSVAGTPDAYPVDGAAGRADSLVAVADLVNVAASIQPAGGHDIWVYSQRGLAIDTEIYLPFGVTCQADDVISDDTTGERYLVSAFGDECRQDRVSFILCRKLA